MSILVIRTDSTPTAAVPLTNGRKPIVYPLHLRASPLCHSHTLFFRPLPNSPHYLAHGTLETLSGIAGSQPGADQLYRRSYWQLVCAGSTDRPSGRTSTRHRRWAFPSRTDHNQAGNSRDYHESLLPGLKTKLPGKQPRLQRCQRHLPLGERKHCPGQSCRDNERLPRRELPSA